jgi:endonuclease/exonuclease/phosphatase (EEP) superfamily protein YafD
MGPDLAAGAMQRPVQSAEDAPRLRVLTLNVMGFNPGLADVEALIAREAPDIIIFQEAFGAWRDFIPTLAPRYQVAAGCGGDSSCATIILSRFPIERDLAPPTRAIAAARLRLPDNLGGGTLDVMGAHVHWPLPAARQKRQLQQIAEFATGLDADRAILAGDFNCTPWSAAMRTFDRDLPIARRTRAFFSWPTPGLRFSHPNMRAPAPLLPVDHVFAGAHWKLVELRRGEPVGSDHFPIIASFAPAAP